MLLKIWFVAIALYTGTAWAGVEINQADVAALDSIRGVGPSLSRKILAERENGNFKNWSDLMARVPGMKDKTAAKFSAQGLTVDGQSFSESPRPLSAAGQ
jgi:competence protein ComEA